MSKKNLPTKKPAPKTVAVVAGPTRDDKAMIMPLAAIKIGKNVRDQLEGIEELAASIKQNGLMQPLVLAKVPGGLELVAGRRRFAALQLLGVKAAPVRIMGADVAQIEVLRLVENIQRDELSGWETCKAVFALAPGFKTQRELATAIGKTEGYVSKCLAVVKAVKPEQLEYIQGRTLYELFAMLSNDGKARKPSGPQPGGRFVDGAIQLKNTAASGRFSLRINYDPERTPSETRAKILETLKALVAKLEAGAAGS